MNNPFETIEERLSKIETILEDIKTNSSEVTIAADPDQLLTIQQAGEFLKLSVATLYSKVHHAEIPVSKRGKRLYFSRQDLINWVKQGRKKTNEEITDEASQFLAIEKKGSKL